MPEQPQPSIQTKARLSMLSLAVSGAYTTLIVQESRDEFSTSMLDNATETDLPQHNLNTPWLILGEEVPVELPTAQPSNLMRVLIDRMETHEREPGG